jgi:nucleoside-diphosphate-sugar epimerase
MVSTTISKLLKGEKPSCTKGEQLWDYLYAKDAARAFLMLAESGKSGKTYCIGSGKARPLKDYILDIRNAVGSKTEIGFGDIPYSDRQVMHLCADISELTADTGFLPKYTFEQGISETVDWCRKVMP